MFQDKLQEDIIILFRDYKNLDNVTIFNKLVNEYGHHSLQKKELQYAMEYLTNTRKFFKFHLVAENDDRNNFDKLPSHYNAYKEVMELRLLSSNYQKSVKDNDVFWILIGLSVLGAISQIATLILCK